MISLADALLRGPGLCQAQQTTEPIKEATMLKMALAKMVYDPGLYPRMTIDAVNIRRMVEALQAGEELPPILLDKQTNRIVDGVHRWHAYRRFYDDDSIEVPATTQSYKSERAIYVDAVSLNARHGLGLEPQDQVKVLLTARELGITPVEIARALAMPVERLERVETRIGMGPDGKPVIIKPAMAPKFTGRRLNKRQMATNNALSGNLAGYYLRMTIQLLESDSLDWTDTRIVALVERLRTALAKMAKAA